MLAVLFGCRGRINRVEMLIFIPFSIGWGLLAASFWYTQFADLEGAVEDLGWEALIPTLLDPLPHLIATVLIFALFVMWCLVARAAMTKRLHDRGKSGHWLFLLAAGPLVLLGLLFVPFTEGPAGFAEGALVALAIADIAWFLRELFWLPGTDGDNRFGPETRRIDRPQSPA